MRRKMLPVLGSLLAIAMLFGFAGFTTAHAQDGTPPTPPALPAGDRGPHDGRGFGEAELQAAADALGMTTEELSSALQGGSTLEQIAEQAGVEVATVQDAIRAVHEEQMRARIEQGVSDGTISQEKADWLLEGLEKGFLDGPGFGFGFGHPGGRSDGGTLPSGTMEKE